MGPRFIKLTELHSVCGLGGYEIELPFYLNTAFIGSVTVCESGVVGITTIDGKFMCVKEGIEEVCLKMQLKPLRHEDIRKT